MTREAIRAFCLGLPHVTERFQFHHAAFQIGAKSFAMVNLEVEGFPLAFKCTQEDFGELVEIPGRDSGALFRKEAMGGADGVGYASGGGIEGMANESSGRDAGEAFEENAG